MRFTVNKSCRYARLSSLLPACSGPHRTKKLSESYSSSILSVPNDQWRCRLSFDSSAVAVTIHSLWTRFSRTRAISRQPHADTPIRRHADTFLPPPAPRILNDCGLDFIVSLLFLAALCAPIESRGQWVPPDSLRDVPVLDDCAMTKHGIGLSVQPNLIYPRGAIFMCPEREREIDARHPGASRFFLVHEYGHLAMHSRLEAVADEWAAKQLALVPGERGTLRAVVLHFVDQGTLFDPLYGSGFDRALRVARAGDVPSSEWPRPLVDYENAQAAAKEAGASLAVRVTGSYANAAQMVIFLDKKPVGVLSNLDQSKPLDLPPVSPGRHLIQASQIWLYHVEPGGPKSEVAERLEAECEFESSGKKAIAVDVRFDGETVSLQAVELR
jgi:hypothetical protein